MPSPAEPLSTSLAASSALGIWTAAMVNYRVLYENIAHEVEVKEDRV